CTNMVECWLAGMATFMILGNIYIRSCSFCSVATGRYLSVYLDEPNRVAESVRLMEVKHCVITLVNCHYLKDDGSTIWAETVNAIRRESPQTTLETLIPDLSGIWDNLDRVLAVRPEVVSHNLETVRRLTREVRIQAKYDRSLE